ncbi:glycosyltransferase [Flavobacterium daejeonense]|uniref:glycosyltransferase n=1 Tax=Flavobacterium daejeonense TaxID=350893 RepID=UPI000479CF11|nr:glycosyltransferase [Flavobacterium daejeonense]
MKFLIITHVVHSQRNQKYFAYEPYVREMNLWLKNVEEVMVIAPIANHTSTAIDSAYEHQNIDFKPVAALSLTTLKNTLITLFEIPGILYQIYKAMQQADHIHLRCPGNMGLLACILQIFFPSTTKTAKYAGNWDSKSKQPWSYRLQKWILSNTFLTRNIKVLVYGEWDNQSANIQSFFTASYSEREEKTTVKTIGSNENIRLLFVGSLVEGKNPLYAIRLLEQLKQTNLNVQLDVFGDGPLRRTLQNYIEKHTLSECVFLHGNQNQEVLKKAYQKSHFVILASKSEGWPKAIAEGMFWGCVPIATAVSCVPEMLDYGHRGILLQMDTEKDTDTIATLINNPDQFEKRSKEAINWSRKYTLEYFETEIKKLLQK